MNAYEQRKQAKIERIENRIRKKKEFSSNNDLSLYGESKSGIPMGQPILVGHHSEKRHRKHLERIENKVRKGYEAAKEAERLEDRLESIENRRAIDSDNPNALNLLNEKIEKLENERIKNKKLNLLVKKSCSLPNSIYELSKMLTETHPNYSENERMVLAGKLLEKDFCGRIGIPSWWFTNRSAEIRRLKKRVEELKTLENGWEPIKFDGGRIESRDGRILIFFDEIPAESTRSILKASPFAFKWSPSVGAWSRKHTPTTQSEFFRKQLVELKERIFDNGK